MRILIVFAVSAITLCLGSSNVSLGQGQDMRLPTEGSVPSNGNPYPNLTPVDVSVSTHRVPGSREPRVLTRGPLAPSDQDRANHAAFLTQPNTGLVRLLPRQVAGSSFYRKPPVKINGGGAYYSFAYRSHEYGDGSDLELGTPFVFKRGAEQPPYHYLSVGFAGADFGMLTNLGETPLETLTVNDSRAEFLRTYKPPQRESEARREYGRFHPGVTIDGVRYSGRLPVQVGVTYLLRSINYDTSDVLVAFRVVRQDKDESLIIAWKLLKQFGTPTLHRSK